MYTLRHRLSRRTLLRSAVVGGSGLLAAYLVGCGDDGQPRPTATATPPATPRPGTTPTATAAPSAFSWRQVSPAGPLPPFRRDHSLVSDGQRLFLFGGREQKVLGDLWSYDIANSSWSEVTPDGPPPARFGHNAILYEPQGRMVVFGGQAGGTFFNDLWAFDIASGQWSQLLAGESAPAPRYGAASTFDPTGRFLVSHGFTDAGRFDDTWAYHLDSGVWADHSPRDTRPVERCLMRAVWDAEAERLLMFGGQTNATPFLGDLWALGEGGWTEITAAPKPSPRKFYALVFDDEGGRAILFGGDTQDGPVNDLWFFDSASDTWSQQSPEGEGPSARFGHDAVWLPASRSLLVFGGSDGSQDLNDLWELSRAA